MELTKNDLTTYATTIILAVTSYFGIAEATQSQLIQILAPIIAIILAAIVKYFDEKYPSSIITPVTVVGNDETSTTTTEEDAI
jgi:hypothetical protein